MIIRPTGAGHIPSDEIPTYSFTTIVKENKLQLQEAISPLSFENTKDLKAISFDTIQEGLGKIKLVAYVALDMVKNKEGLEKILSLLEEESQKINKLSPPKEKETAKATSENNLSKGKYFNVAQKLALENNFVESVLKLEEYGNLVKKEALDELDISQIFDIREDTIGVTYKGISSIAEYNSNILSLDDDEVEELGVHRNLKEIKDILKTNQRGLLLFNKTDQKFHLFKLNEETEVLLFDRTTSKWVKCDNDMLKALKLDKDDLCISLGKEIPSMEGAGLYHRKETRESSLSKDEHFYHESQGGPFGNSFSGIHAFNAFFGFHALDMSSYYVIAKELIRLKLKIPLEDSFKVGSVTADVRKIANSKFLLKYLKELNKLGKLPKNYDNMKIDQVKSDGMWNDDAIAAITNGIDRFIIGYGTSHFVAVRKDTNSGKCYIIDSMDEKSQDTAYDSLADAIKKPDRASTDSISIIHQ
ncbi:MAG: hypothetical protein H0W88_10830 [Parachlamydiaceae bacterium]|nr:hypothetical protein [Parachlamydiaceae bacterium]